MMPTAQWKEVHGPVGKQPLEALESMIGGGRAAKHSKGTTMARSRSELSHDLNWLSATVPGDVQEKSSCVDGQAHTDSSSVLLQRTVQAISVLETRRGWIDCAHVID
jgi:hypothetical protein